MIGTLVDMVSAITSEVTSTSGLSGPVESSSMPVRTTDKTNENKHLKTNFTEVVNRRGYAKHI